MPLKLLFQEVCPLMIFLPYTILYHGIMAYAPSNYWKIATEPVGCEGGALSLELYFVAVLQPSPAQPL